MRTAIIIAGMIALAAIVLAVLGIADEIGRHHPSKVLWRVLTGRHYSGRRHTNANFFRDSNKRVIGEPTIRITNRHHRAGWKNLIRSSGIIAAVTLSLYGLLVDRIPAIIGILTVITGALGYKVTVTVKALRKSYQNNIIVRPLARALAVFPGTSETDMEGNIALRDGYQDVKKGSLGRIYWPDTFHANDTEKQEVSQLVNRRLPRDVELTWHPPIRNQLQYSEIVAAPPLPRKILFKDRLDDIDALKPLEYIGGYDRHGNPLILSHNGEKPMKAFSMDSGTGKSTLLRSIIAQIKLKTPEAWIHIFDTKRVSLECFRGIPRVQFYSDPANMREMWNGWESLKREMDSRYEAYQRDPTAVEGMDPIFIFLEEGNDFSVQIKALWQNEMRQKGEPANPPIWYKIASILWQGREVKIFVIAVLQNFMDKYFGGISLRPAFGTIGMAGYKPSQWRTIIGTTPVPVRQDGQGRICIVEGREETWIQGMFAEKQWFSEFAAEACRELRPMPPAASSVPLALPGALSGPGNARAEREAPAA